MKLVEVIPNFSEGRRPEVVDQIVAAMQTVDGIQILDRHSDDDHNRSVVTIVGEPESAVHAAFAGIQAAAKLIDLDKHSGEHPRLGATDVVPFVPLREVSMEQCVELARSLGQQVGEQLDIPVYLYEAAATRPERTNLEDIRRGEYEGLKHTIADDPEREPDYGPRKLGPAGATVIGARAPLIAYNVYLTTDEVSIAKRIAKAVRFSGGGLRYVKALGLLVEGRAQVSMNLTDFTKTPVYRVVELIRREAERFGVAVHHSELVGLTPQAALIDAAQWYLQLDDLQADQILENRLFTDAASPDGEQPLLDRLAAGTATPGGGSAAAHTGAMGAALVAMVGRLTVGKKKYAEVEAEAQRMIGEAETLRDRMAAAVEEDAQAFEAVMTALRMPKERESEQLARNQALQDATVHAGEVPLAVARDAAKVIALASEMASIGNANAITDAATAASLAHAALHSAGLNVRINAGGLDDQELAERWQNEVKELESAADERLKTIRATLVERAGIGA